MFNIFNRNKTNQREDDVQLIERLLNRIDSLHNELKRIKKRDEAETHAVAIYNAKVRALIGAEKYKELTDEYLENRSVFL